MRTGTLFSLILALLGCSILLALAATGCGGDSSNSQQPPTSNLTKRAFVSNDFDSTLHIEDAQRDEESGFLISVGFRPGPMALSADKKLTLVFHMTENTLGVVDNATEQLTGRVPLPDFSDSFVSLSDDTTGFVAVRNVNAVEVVSLTTFVITKTISLPTPRRIVLSHDGKKLLVFSDGLDTVTVIDTVAQTAGTPIAGFDRPVWGVFSSDDSKAYILNCGAECGGTPSGAGVTVLDMATSTPGASVPLSAATFALLDSGKLYVAGTPPGAGCTPGTTAATTCGCLNVLDASSLSVITADLEIADGFHDRMELGSNGKLFIGSRVCSNIDTTGEQRGCLTIFDTASAAAKVASDLGDVTGIAPISGRDVVYVVQGGELVIYDTNTDAPQTKQIDIVGEAVDVKYVDQ